MNRKDAMWVNEARVWAEVRRLYRPEAEEIAEHLCSGQSVILEGRNGVGKSFLLCPELCSLMEQKGYATHWTESIGHGVDYCRERIGEQLEQKEGARPKAVIIDEAGLMVEKTQTDAEKERDWIGFLSELRHKEIASIFVIPGIRQKARTRAANLLRHQAEKAGMSPHHHLLRQQTLPLGALQELIAIRGGHSSLSDVVANEGHEALLHPLTGGKQFLWRIDLPGKQRMHTADDFYERVPSFFHLWYSQFLGGSKANLLRFGKVLVGMDVQTYRKREEYWD